MKGVCMLCIATAMHAACIRLSSFELFRFALLVGASASAGFQGRLKTLVAVSRVSRGFDHALMLFKVCEAALPTNERECGVCSDHPPQQCYGCCCHSPAVPAVPVLLTLLCMQATRCGVNLLQVVCCVWVEGDTADMVWMTGAVSRMHMTCICHMLLTLCLWSGTTCNCKVLFEACWRYCRLCVDVSHLSLPALSICWSASVTRFA
jgi:hypothetical protein